VKARLIAPVIDLLLDWILLLVRDDTPATVATTFQEIAQLLAGDIHSARHHCDPTYETAVSVHLDTADSGLFDTLRCYSRDQLISLSTNGCAHIVIRLIEAETGGNNG
jgi:hypothetical protein